ncbi:MAG: AraC family transcriptional regulator [Curvibacter sp.]|nr:AraC family transcriptional regulator [Curvibacter sp.]
MPPRVRPQPEPADTPIAATPIAFVQAIAWAYEQRRQDPGPALKKAQIEPDLLLNPQACVTSLQFELLSGAAMQELDDEALGWFSRRLPWGSYGMLARASLSAPSLGRALQRWCRHHGLIADDIRLELSRNDAGATITLHENRPLGRLREFCLVSVLRNLHGLACWYIDSRIPLQEAAFPFPAPAHAAVYPLLFPGPIRFDAAQAQLKLDARYLDLPLRRDEAALQQMLQRALPLTVLQYRRDRLLVQRVRQLLVSQPQETQSAEALAHWLHISPRTLHRQLKEEGANLQALKDEVRRERATDLLLRTGKPVKQVAEAAGFRNEKSFMRAFRDWTGLSPAEFRRQTLAP